jgi:hypothetical protein
MAEETDDPKSSRKGHGLKKRSGAKRPERPAAGAELREVYESLLTVDCVGSAYFDTALNSGPAPYTLTGEPLRVFRELMADPRSVTL